MHSYEHEHINHHDHHAMNTKTMAAAATLHCLMGCAIGEIAGMVIGTTAGWSNQATVFISIILAFVFGIALSLLPLLKSGVALKSALPIVLAADTLSIATMEVFDNILMVVIPGAMSAGLVNPTFWWSLPLGLLFGYLAAYPVNYFLLKKGKGHALTMNYHAEHGGN